VEVDGLGLVVVDNVQVEKENTNKQVWRFVVKCLVSAALGDQGWSLSQSPGDVRNYFIYSWIPSRRYQIYRASCHRSIPDSTRFNIP
jgi:hypothetical protein